MLLSDARAVLWSLLVWCAVSACKPPEPDYVTVAVYPSTQQCGIDEQRMVCDQVATYLRDTLKIKMDKQVIVSSVGIDPLPKEDASLEKIAATISALGFKDVRTARFDVR